MNPPIESAPKEVCSTLNWNPGLKVEYVHTRDHPRFEWNDYVLGTTGSDHFFCWKLTDIFCRWEAELSDWFDDYHKKQAEAEQRRKDRGW